MKTMGVISDTHGVLRPEVAAQLFKSMTAYVDGDIDLDAALNQVDAVLAAGATP